MKNHVVDKQILMNSASQKPFFSLLIASKNAEETINRCIDSIVKQTFSSFEIIVVDDSSDNTGTLLKERDDIRIHIFKQKTVGIMAAREELLALASGQFVLFVDSDDCLKVPTALQTIYDSINNSSSDVVVFQFVIQYTDTFVIQYTDTKLISLIHDSIDENDGQAVFNETMQLFLSTDELNPLWNKAVRREFYKDCFVGLPKITFGEDRIISYSLFRKKPKITFIQDSLYQYNIILGSATRKFVPSYLRDLSISSGFIEKSLIEDEESILLNNLYLYYLRTFIAYVRSSIVFSHDKITKKQLRMEINGRDGETVWTHAFSSYKNGKIKLSVKDRVQLPLVIHKCFFLLRILAKVYSVVVKRKSHARNKGRS